MLEDFLNTFVGIVITVSHDRYFLDNVVDRIFEFDGNGNLLQYEGGYTDYLEAKDAVSAEVRKKRQKQRRPKRPRTNLQSQRTMTGSRTVRPA